MPELRANWFDCEQGSPEWLKLRAGCKTSSRVAELLPAELFGKGYLQRKSNGKEKGEESQARADYRGDLIAERLSGQCVDHYVSVWMKEGREKEPLARAAYELEIGEMVDRIGFVLHPEIHYCGSSPDALVGKRGLAEFKCPKVRTHLDYLLAGVVPKEYKPQMYHQMACDDERDWNDFVSFCPILPKAYRIFICRLPRDNEIIGKMETEIRKFGREVDAELTRIQNMYGNGPSATEEILRQSIAIAKGGRPTLVELARELVP